MKRLWLGINVRPVAPMGSASRKPYVDSALIHHIFPDELLFEVFARMTPYNLGRASCVCRKWRYTIHNPVFWRNACLKAWQLTGLVKNYKLLQLKYEGSWRKCGFRDQGFYVSRNTYIRVGVAKWKVTNPMHLKKHFTFFFFFHLGRETHPQENTRKSSTCLLSCNQILDLFIVWIENYRTLKGMGPITDSKINRNLYFHGIFITSIFSCPLRLG
ncbi:hypothetical protein UlMin_038411 [Ulmus minor]